MKYKFTQLRVVSVVIVISLSALMFFNWPFYKKAMLTFPIDKATAEIIASEKVKSEFRGAKLIRSSEKVEKKLGLDGWIFIYESEGIFGWNRHSAAIMVDINTGETLVQRAY